MQSLVVTPTLPDGNTLPIVVERFAFRAIAPLDTMVLTIRARRHVETRPSAGIPANLILLPAGTMDAAFVNFAPPVDLHLFPSALLGVRSHDGAETFGNFAFAGAHVVEAVLVKRFGVDVPVAVFKEIGFDILAVFFRSGLILDIEVARVGLEAVGDVVAFFFALPFVGEGDDGVFHVVLRREEIVLLVVVEGAAETFRFALEGRGDVDVGAGDSVPPNFQPIW